MIHRSICIAIAAMTFVFQLNAQDLFQAIDQGDIKTFTNILDDNPGLLNSKNQREMTLLNQAAYMEQTEMVRDLIKRGADANIGDFENTLPIHHAAIKGNREIYDMLFALTPDINIKDDSKQDALMFAIYFGQPEMAQYLISKGADVKTKNVNGWSPMLFAAIRGDLVTMKQLVEKGADVNVRSNNGTTPLYSASSYAQTEMVKYLLSKGVKADVETDEGETPLSVSRMPDCIEAIKILLENGADVNHKDKRGRIPLCNVIWRGSLDIVKLHIDKGANINTVDNSGQTPLALAASAPNSDEMSKLLIMNGANVNVAECAHEKECSCPPNHTSPLHAAASRQKTNMIKNLVKSGAKINVYDESGNTPLHIAITSGNYENVKYLLENGAFLNIKQDETGYSELHFAAIKGYTEIARLLIEHGADVNLRDVNNRSAFELAWYYGQKETSYVLLANGSDDQNLAKCVNQAPPLENILGNEEAEVYFLGHSGWAISTRNHFLIFDYFDREEANPVKNKSLLSGYIEPDELKDKNVMVFSSHNHRDHYNKNYFKWSNTIGHIEYVFGHHPQDTTAAYHYMAPRTDTTIDNVKITTHNSVDSGVGFLVEVDGLVIHHVGDHANGNDKLIEEYTSEIDFIAQKGLKIDLAFSPVRGCGLGTPEQVILGTDYMIEKLKPEVMIPMHGGEYTTLLKRTAESINRKHNKNIAVYVKNKGDRFTYKGGSVSNTDLSERTD